MSEQLRLGSRRGRWNGRHLTQFDGAGNLGPLIAPKSTWAYKLLPLVDGLIDVAVGESVVSTYDFARQQYGPVRQDWFEQQRDWLLAARHRRPNLLVFTLDYCDPRDTIAIRQAYQRERSAGFAPYIATIGLNAVIPEPVHAQ
jgi:hypothetical protein